MKKGEFDMNDLAEQLKQMKKMGGLQGIMGMLPGVAKMKNQMADSGIDDRMIARQEAIISSMTKIERKKPDLLNASRKKRVAAGAGPGIAAGGDEQDVIVRIWIVAFADARLDRQRTIDQLVHALRLSREITLGKRLRVA